MAHVTQELIDLLSQNIGVKIITEIDNYELADDYNSTVNEDHIEFVKTRMSKFDDLIIVELWDDVEEVVGDNLAWELHWDEEEFEAKIKEEVSKLQWEDVILIRAN